MQVKKGGFRITKEGYNEMSLSDLVAYIMKVQQPYLRTTLSSLRNNPETIRMQEKGSKRAAVLAAVVENLAVLVEKHLDEKETQIFPLMIKKVENPKTPLPESQIRKIKEQQGEIKECLITLRRLSNEYEAPPGSIPLLKLCYAQLFNFEQDMLKSIFLEEEILFQKLIKPVH